MLAGPTCQNCVHGASFKCAHPDGYGRPTYAVSDGMRIYADACELYEQSESQPQESATPAKAEFQHRTICTAGMDSFDEALTDLLNDGYQLASFNPLMSPDGNIFFVQTLIKQGK